MGFVELCGQLDATPETPGKDESAATTRREQFSESIRLVDHRDGEGLGDVLGDVLGGVRHRVNRANVHDVRVACDLPPVGFDLGVWQVRASDQTVKVNVPLIGPPGAFDLKDSGTAGDASGPEREPAKCAKRRVDTVNLRGERLSRMLQREREEADGRERGLTGEVANDPCRPLT